MPLPSLPRRLYVISDIDIGPVSLGPVARQFELVEGGLSCGVAVVLVARSCTRDLPDRVSFLPFSSLRIADLRGGHAIVVSAYLPGPWLRRLAATDIPFHADLYCLTATEILPGLDALPDRRAWTERWRRILRYAVLCHRAERVYVSSNLQTTLLGGMFLSLPGREAQRLAFGLPAKTIPAPMVPSGKPFPWGGPNPYEEILGDRPVFLWGGGIWKWFDVETVIRAFALLQERNSSAALFFLTAKNISSHGDQEAPHEEALRLARSLGVLGKSVFFNDQPVSPDRLPPYLEHCHAGVLGNHAHLESTASWRTRQLDLLWAGRPGLVSGHDPLSDLMALRGACWQCGSGDALGLAGLVESSLDLHAHEMACRASHRLAGELRESGVAGALSRSILDASQFTDSGSSPPRAWIARYLLGL